MLELKLNVFQFLKDVLGVVQVDFVSQEIKGDGAVHGASIYKCIV